MHDKLFKSVLLIDDNDMDSRINKIVIQSSDFAHSIHTARNATEGIQFLKDAESKTLETPDFLFLDLYMPETDGFGFLDLYAQLSNSIKDKCRLIIVSSADGIDYDRAILNPHVYSYLKKPLNTLELLALATCRLDS